MDEEKEIELRIYSEAGQACRSHEVTSRTGELLFVAIQAAILAFIQRQGLLSAANIPIEIFGIFICFVVYVMLFRQRLYYRSFIKTARRVEKTIDPSLRLYTRAWKFVNRASRKRGKLMNKVIELSGEKFGSKIDTLDRRVRGRTNKWLLAALPFVLGWVYGGLIIVQVIF